MPAAKTEVQDLNVSLNYTGSLNNKLLRYGFILLRDPNKPLESPGNEYVTLNLAPERIDIEEPAATSITPTQNAGKWVERYGQVTKTITIAGTTGFTPYPKTDVIFRRALSADQIIQRESLNSGMARFVQLRNLFRTYWEIFSAESNVNNVKSKAQFIFVNEKDDEQWLVEPISFRMERQSPRNKFTYSYAITLHTLARYENIGFPEYLTTFDKIRNLAAEARAAAAQLAGIIGALGDTLLFVAGVVQQLVQVIFENLRSLELALTDVATGVNTVLNIPRTTVAYVSAQVQELLRVVDDLSGIAPQLRYSDHVALLDAVAITSQIAARDDYFAQDFSAQWETATANYDPAYGVGGFDSTLVSPTAQSGVIDTTVQRGDTIQSIARRELGDVERYFELIVLNGLKPPYISPSQEERAPNTLAPGDAILIPATTSTALSKSNVQTNVFADPVFTGDVAASGATALTLVTGASDFRVGQWEGFTVTITEGPGAGQTRKVVANTGDTLTVDKAWDVLPTGSSVARIALVRVAVTPIKAASEQLLGTDLQIYEGDAVITPSGDLALVQGLENMKQAVIGKFQTPVGGLPAHPWFGVEPSLGRQQSADTLFAHKVNVKRLLLSDSRVLSVDQLNVVASGGILEVQGTVALNGQSRPYAFNAQGVA